MENEWTGRLEEYVSHTENDQTESSYLRNQGLIPSLVKLSGFVDGLDILDVGCGSMSLAKHLRGKGHYNSCDVRDFSINKSSHKVCALPNLDYETESFDLVICSLVLIWCEDLDACMQELSRVVRSGGKIVISIMTPDYYRTGELGDSSVLIRDNLTRREKKEIFIGREVGPFSYIRRPYIDYLNSGISAGLSLDGAKEWAIDVDDYKKRLGSFAQNRTGNAPLYSFLRWKK